MDSLKSYISRILPSSSHSRKGSGRWKREGGKSRKGRSEGQGRPVRSASTSNMDLECEPDPASWAPYQHATSPSHPTTLNSAAGEPDSNALLSSETAALDWTDGPRSPPCKPPRKDRVFCVDLSVSWQVQDLGLEVDVLPLGANSRAADQTSVPTNNGLGAHSAPSPTLGTSQAARPHTSAPACVARVVGVRKEGVAGRDGRVRVGDEVVEVNGKSLLRETSESVRLLLRTAARSGRVTLTLRRRRKHSALPPPIPVRQTSSLQEPPSSSRRSGLSADNVTNDTPTTLSPCLPDHTQTPVSNSVPAHKVNHAHNYSTHPDHSSVALHCNDLSDSDDDVFGDSSSTKSSNTHPQHHPLQRNNSRRGQPVIDNDRRGHHVNDDSRRGQLVNDDSRRGQLINDDSRRGQLVNDDSTCGQLVNDDSRRDQLANERSRPGQPVAKDSRLNQYVINESRRGQSVIERSGYDQTMTEGGRCGQPMNEGSRRELDGEGIKSEKICDGEVRSMGGNASTSKGLYRAHSTPTVGEQIQWEVWSVQEPEKDDSDRPPSNLTQLSSCRDKFSGDSNSATSISTNPHRVPANITANGNDHTNTTTTDNNTAQRRASIDTPGFYGNQTPPPTSRSQTLSNTGGLGERSALNHRSSARHRALTASPGPLSLGSYGGGGGGGGDPNGGGSVSSSSSPVQSGKKRVISKLQLVKDARGLGLHIAGGKGSKRGDIGIFVAALTEAGAAFRDGRLKRGDELLMINGRSLVGLTHQEAVDVLRGAPSTVNLVVATKLRKSASIAGTSLPSISRVMSPPISLMARGQDLNPSPAAFHQTTVSPLTSTDQANTSRHSSESGPSQTLTVQRGGRGERGLGFTVVGGADRQSSRHVGVHVKRIFASGAVAEDGRLREGDEILAVNGASVQGLTHQNLMALFRTLPAGPVTFTIRSLPSTHSTPRTPASSTDGSPVSTPSPSLHHTPLHSVSDSALSAESSSDTNSTAQNSSSPPPPLPIQRMSPQCRRGPFRYDHVSDSVSSQDDAESRSEEEGGGQWMSPQSRHVDNRRQNTQRVNKYESDSDTSFYSPTFALKQSASTAWNTESDSDASLYSLGTGHQRHVDVRDPTSAWSSDQVSQQRSQLHHQSPRLATNNNHHPNSHFFPNRSVTEQDTSESSSSSSETYGLKQGVSSQRQGVDSHKQGGANYRQGGVNHKHGRVSPRQGGASVCVERTGHQVQEARKQIDVKSPRTQRAGHAPLSAAHSKAVKDTALSERVKAGLREDMADVTSMSSSSNSSKTGPGRPSSRNGSVLPDLTYSRGCDVRIASPSPASSSQGNSQGSMPHGNPLTETSLESNLQATRTPSNAHYRVDPLSGSAFRSPLTAGLLSHHANQPFAFQPWHDSALGLFHSQALSLMPDALHGPSSQDRPSVYHTSSRSVQQGSYSNASGCASYTNNNCYTASSAFADNCTYGTASCFQYQSNDVSYSGSSVDSHYDAVSPPASRQHQQHHHHRTSSSVVERQGDGGGAVVSSRQDASWHVTDNTDIVSLDVLLHKGGGDSVGISVVRHVVGGVSSVLVQDITPGSLAHRDARLRKGDVLYSVNGRPLADLSLLDVFQLFRSLPQGPVRIRGARVSAPSVKRQSYV